MAFNKYVPWNNAQSQLLAGISAGSTTFIVNAWEGDRFPSTFPFLVEVKNNDPVTPFSVLKREIRKVTGRVGDTFTATRSAGTCLPNDASNTPGTTAFAFSSGDTVTLTVTAETIKDIQDEVSTKLATAGGLRTDFGVDKTVVVNRSTGNEEVKAVTYWTTLLPTDIIRVEKTSWNYEDITFNQFQSAISPSAIVDQQFYSWESLAIWDSLFAEWTPAFASATTVINISDVTANTRIFAPIFGNGVAMTTFKLALRKTGTPTQNLNFRIESDDGTGKPSGSLFHANWTANVTQASLTTSFADTTVTMGGSITIPAGQLCHIVMYQWTYGTETINNTNYYQVWISSSHSNSRYAGWHNGTSYSRKWANSTWTYTGDSFNSTQASPVTTFTASKPFYLTQVNLSNSGTAIQPTVVIAQSTRGSMSAVASSYVATFATPFLIYPWTFTITLNYWSAVNVRNATWYSPTSPLFTSTPSSTLSITGVVWQEEMTIPYVSSSGILSTVISKTSANLSYKLGSYPSFATKIIAKWNACARAILGEIAIAWTVDNTLYYIADIDGWVSSSAWTNSSKAGKWFGTWTLFIDKSAV